MRRCGCEAGVRRCGCEAGVRRCGCEDGAGFHTGFFSRGGNVCVR